MPRPLYTFSIAAPEEWLDLLLFLVVAIAMGRLSALQLQRRHTLFGRVEHVDKDELFAHDQPLSGAAFTINKLSLGYQFDFAQLGPLRLAVGAMASRHWIPDALAPSYGRDPTSYTLFIRANLSD